MLSAMNPAHVRHFAPFVAMLASLLLITGCPGAEDPDENQEDPPEADAGDDAGDDVENDVDEPGDEAMIPGLEDDVTVHYDDAGMLHVECEVTSDCFVAQGYFHASDRFGQMDMIRSQTRGELSQLVGFDLGLDNDEYWRHVMSTADGEPLEDAYLDELDDDTREMIDSYSDGVNAWLDDLREGENDATLPDEFDFPLVYEIEHIRDWEAEDTVATYLQLSMQFSGMDRQLNFGELAADVDPEIFRDVSSPRPGVESFIIDASEEAMVTGPDDSPPVAHPQLDDIQARLAPASDILSDASQRVDAASSILFGPSRLGEGSNNWVVAPERTAGSSTYLANDPHLAMTNPSIWYFNRLKSHDEDRPLHAAGAAVPASPGVAVGHNEDVAWGVTVAFYDLLDVYVDELTDDGDAIEHADGPIELEERTWQFEDRDGNTEEATVYWVPDRGPVIEKDDDAGQAVSFQWVGHEVGDDIEFLPGLMEAESMDDAMEAIDHVRVMNMNWVVTDADGNIGWYPNAKVPDRSAWASPELPSYAPLPGDGTADWDGFLPSDVIPRLENPPAGYIATANNDFDGSLADGNPTADGSPLLQSNTAPGHRHYRIVELMEASTDHDIDSMHDIIGDAHSVQGEMLVPLVVDAIEEADELSDEGEAVYHALDAWNYDCPSGLDGLDPDEADPVADADVGAEAVGCAAFHVFAMELSDRIFAESLADHGSTFARDNWAMLQDTILDLFERPEMMDYGEQFLVDAAGDTDVAQEVFEDALDAAGDWLVGEFDSDDADDWLWGRIHAANFHGLLPGVAQFDEGPAATPGGWQTVNVADPDPGEDGSVEFEHANGVSFRLLVEMSDDGPESYFQLPGGQVHHRDSPFYHNLVEDWVYNQSASIPFSSEDAADRAEKTFYPGEPN